MLEYEGVRTRAPAVRENKIRIKIVSHECTRISRIIKHYQCTFVKSVAVGFWFEGMGVVLAMKEGSEICFIQRQNTINAS